MGVEESVSKIVNTHTTKLCTFPSDAKPKLHSRASASSANAMTVPLLGLMTCVPLSTPPGLVSPKAVLGHRLAGTICLSICSPCATQSIAADFPVPDCCATKFCWTHQQTMMDKSDIESKYNTHRLRIWVAMVRRLHLHLHPRGTAVRSGEERGQKLCVVTAPVLGKCLEELLHLL